MLRYIYADQLDQFPRLAETMFKDRAAQFHTRLGWEVQVDDTGAERDSYDDLSPMYIAWERPNGTHGGSLRLLPTTGDTMINDHFLDHHRRGFVHALGRHRGMGPASHRPGRCPAPAQQPPRIRYPRPRAVPDACRPSSRSPRPHPAEWKVFP